MRKTFAFCIMLSFLAQTSGRVFLIVGYYANKTPYAKNCINKSRPMMHCNGKCQLMKKILQEEKNEQENTERRENLKHEVLSSKSFFASLKLPFIGFISSVKNVPVSNGTSIDRCFDIFHPPQA